MRFIDTSVFVNAYVKPRIGGWDRPDKVASCRALELGESMVSSTRTPVSNTILPLGPELIQFSLPSILREVERQLSRQGIPGKI